MAQLAHWHIEAQNGVLSAECVDRGIISFQSLLEWVEQLPYKRNSDRSNYALVLDEECGACSTKNALVKAVADENGWYSVKLFLGLYQLSEGTNPDCGILLQHSPFQFIPEAHVYLKIDDIIRDVTGLPPGKQPFTATLSHELEISPNQIGEFKVTWHKKHLVDYAQQVKQPLSELIQLREKCIGVLSN